MTTSIERPVSLADRYVLRDGEVLLTGLQAAARIAIDQHRLDEVNGLRTATIMSGYPGSPVAGFDLEVSRHASIFEAHDVRLVPAVNEELAATTVQGGQLAGTFGELTHDGVVGMWFGKAPGLDRASDAIRHGNCGGASETGGVLVMVGDDGIAKSSAVPTSSEMTLAELGMTVVSPSDPQDVLDLGLHGIALSRFCGLWTGFKIATNVADGSGSVVVRPRQIDVALPSRVVDGHEFHHQPTADYMSKAHVAQIEDSMMTTRRELARRYARANGLNRIEGDPNATIGLMTHGQAYMEMWEGLVDMGITPDTLPTSGVRILKMGLVSPLEPEVVREFAEGLDEIVVIEEKRSFLETAVKELFYREPDAPAVYGKTGPDGAQLLRAHQDLPAGLIARAIGPRILAHVDIPAVREYLETPQTPPRTTIDLIPVSRPAYFCSGCPHNRSSIVPEGSLVGLGIGCSALSVNMPEERVGGNIGLCQMGGEGVLWIGMAPFLKDRDHFIQGLGDGTFHHSGSLAIRASVAAGSNITFKLLYNGTVAMTGGQPVAGGMSVPDLARSLLAEGVKKVAITTDDIDAYKGVDLPAGVAVHHRDELLPLQEELAEIEGVTVLIHDQDCAAELRRQRKRNLVVEPNRRAFINERVCEGCGDCGIKSNCLSVQPVDTEFGRKTMIHQASCNLDFSCLEGECPAFVDVVPGKKPPKRHTVAPLGADGLPKPKTKVHLDDFNLRLTGIGGTGVVTTARVLGTAALMAGLHVRALDQLGVAQKGGAVVSDIKLSSEPFKGTNKVEPGDCDLYLGCDIIVASADKNLETTSADRTIAIVSSSRVPTGTMVANPSVTFPDTEAILERIRETTRSDEDVFADVRQLTLALFGDDQVANIFLVGMAVQAGALPIESTAIEGAIELNGVAVDMNIQAFRRGRQFIADPEALMTVLPTDVESEPEHSAAAEEIAATVATVGDPELASTVLLRVDELIAYQDVGYARRYATKVEEVRRRETEVLGTSGRITLGVARNLYKLMAYKDEYEVARLLVDPKVDAELKAEFGDDVSYAYRLHPPVLRMLGKKDKISLGPWVRPVLRVLYRMRGLRKSRLDPFGFGKVRRTERRLITEYSDAIDTALNRLDEENQRLVAELAELPDVVRGYEHVKLATVDRFRDRLSGLLASL